MERPSSETAIVRPLSGKDLVPTIFHEPWWLRIVGGGDEKEAIVESGGMIVGRWPYRGTRVWGQTLVRMPALAHVLGPAVSTVGSATSRSRREFAITSQLIAQVSGTAHIHARLHAGIRDTLAFKAAGYEVGVDYTVEIAPDLPDVVWTQMRDKNRNAIRRARERLDVLDTLEPGRFLDFYDDNLRSRSLGNFYARPMMAAVIDESLRRGVGRLLSAVDGARALQAAIFTVWDDQAEYYFMSTRRIQSDNGAVSLLIWQAIQHAHARKLKFDMDGLHVSRHALPNYLLLTGFGGAVTPRYVVSRSSAAMKCALQARSLFSAGVRCAAR